MREKLWWRQQIYAHFAWAKSFEREISAWENVCTVCFLLNVYQTREDALLQYNQLRIFYKECSQSQHVIDVDVAGNAIKQLKTTATCRWKNFWFEIQICHGKLNGNMFAIQSCHEFQKSNLQVSCYFFHGKFHGTLSHFMASFVATYLPFFKFMATWQLSWQVGLAICYDATIATWQVCHGKSDLPRPFAICHIAPWKVSVASF